MKLLERQDPAAEWAFRRAIESGGRQAPALQGLGLALYNQCRFAEAEALFREAEPIEEVPALARYHAGLCRLVQGDTAAGWPLWEQRLAVQNFGHIQLPLPRWTGESLAGKRLLVLAEQGYGDVIQFSRFLPKVAAESGAALTFVSTPPLERLYEPMAKAHGFRLVASQIVPGEYDAFAAVCSLASIYQSPLDALPGTQGYLTWDKNLAADWRAKLPGGRLKVGLCWAGRPSHPQDAARSIPQKLIAGLAKADVALVGLQWPGKDAVPPPAPFLAADWGPEMGDFANTAAQMGALDLIVTVDTAMAHLAGALGKHTWVLLPYAPDWRWQAGRSDSPWYDSVRLFRQPKPGGWQMVIEEVVAALRTAAP